MSLAADLIQLLDSYGLRRRDHVRPVLKKLSQVGIKRLLDEVGDIYLRDPDASLRECQADENEFAIFPEESAPSCQTLVEVKQLILYADRVVLPNPLLALHPDINNKQTVTFGPAKEEDDHQDLARALMFLVDIQPLIRAGWVCFWARELFVDDTAKFYCRALGQNLLSLEMQQYCHEQIRVAPLQVTEQMRLQVVPHQELLPRRAIVTYFATEVGLGGPFPWFLVPIKLGENTWINEDETCVSMSMSAKDLASPVDEDTFNLWIQDCKERTGMLQARKALEHLAFSELFGTRFVAQARPTWDLLRIQASNPQLRTDDTGIASALAELELPFLANVSSVDIVRIRENEEAFSNFRRALRCFARHVTALPGTPEFSRQVRELQSDVVDPELEKLEQNARRLNEKLLVDTLIASASMIAAAITGRPEWLNGVLALLPQLVNLSRGQEEMRGNSMFFLWDLKRRS